MPERPKRIVHVAPVPLSETTGVGRISFHWQKALEARGIEFIHIGPEQIGKVAHPSRFGSKAWQTYQKMDKPADLFLVHEPYARFFLNQPNPVALFSHGLERRRWELSLEQRSLSGEKIPLRTQLLYPFWRLASVDAGARNAQKLLLSSQEDRDYCQWRYSRSASDCFVFRNGIHSPVFFDGQNIEYDVVFNASWIPRKGIRTLIQAAQLLEKESITCRYLLLGTGADEAAVLRDWPESLRTHVTVISRFEPAEETKWLSEARIFVLPSFFEGQPLSLLEAMATGLPCITTDICGQRDVIGHKENGLLFAPGDAKALAEQIQRLLGDPGFAETLAQKARADIAARTWDVVSNEVADVLEALI